MNKNKSQKIGLRESTSLVVGNMIGAGIFMLPASLAKYGAISIFGWIISGIGAIFLAMIFKRLSKKYQEKAVHFIILKKVSVVFLLFLLFGDIGFLFY